MAKKHANKKPKKKPQPSLLETVQGLMANLMVRITTMEKAIQSLDSALSSYIDYHGDGEKWKNWVMKEIEKQKAKENESGDKS